MTPVEKAQKDLADYLAKHPEAKKAQLKIEALLDASGSPDNRLETLRFLIQKEMSKLAKIAPKIKEILDSADKK